MAIKFKISKTAYEKLSDEMKEAYKADGDSYVVDSDLPTPEGTGELTRALERVKAERDDLRDDLKTATTELTEVKKTMTDGDRDVTKLTKRFEQKLETQKAEYEGKLGDLSKVILDGAIESTAAALAAKISTSPAVIKPHIVGRLTAEMGDDLKPVVKIKAADGKVDDKLTVDKLGEEFVANKDFSSIIRGTQANGSRTASQPLGTPAMPGNGGTQAETITDLTKMPLADRRAVIQAKIDARKTA